MIALNETAHRPWPLPRRPWLMAQTWNDLLFAHWPIDADTVRRIVPRGLELDTFDGTAWIGVVPFRMSDVHPRFVPAVRGLSAFGELNLRTYVVHDDKPGVFFWSLDASNPVAVAVARTAFQLPYFRARMSIEADGDRIRYSSFRDHRGSPAAAFAGEYGPTGPVAFAPAGTLAHWLTERYCLYTTHGARIYRGDIQHHQWPLQAATATITLNTVPEAHGLRLPPVAPLLHFARRLEVVVWRLQRVR
ncbi:MAG: DUF2071 domain-containing protein [Herpetosiphon sp.]